MKNKIYFILIAVLLVGLFTSCAEHKTINNLDSDTSSHITLDEATKDSLINDIDESFVDEGDYVEIGELI